MFDLLSLIDKTFSMSDSKVLYIAMSSTTESHIGTFEDHFSHGGCVLACDTDPPGSENSAQQQNKDYFWSRKYEICLFFFTMGNIIFFACPLWLSILRQQTSCSLKLISIAVTKNDYV